MISVVGNVQIIRSARAFQTDSETFVGIYDLVLTVGEILGYAYLLPVVARHSDGV